MHIYLDDILDYTLDRVVREDDSGAVQELVDDLCLGADERGPLPERHSPGGPGLCAGLGHTTDMVRAAVKLCPQLVSACPLRFASVSVAEAGQGPQSPYHHRRRRPFLLEAPRDIVRHHRLPPLSLASDACFYSWDNHTLVSDYNYNGQGVHFHAAP